MVEIDEIGAIVKKVKVQATGGRQKYIYLPAVLEENGLDIHAGDSIELCMDKKNKVVFFRYGKKAMESKLLRCKAESTTQETPDDFLDKRE